MRIIWLPVAKQDLDAIFDFYAEQSYPAAIEIYNSILEDADLIMTHPFIGQIEPLLDDLPYIFRSLVVKTRSHKIIYFIVEDTIFISHVWDCRKDPTTIRRG